ncbi:MAG: hypothetical protein Q9170_002528 [Blastenia crenularia]
MDMADQISDSDMVNPEDDSNSAKSTSSTTLLNTYIAFTPTSNFTKRCGRPIASKAKTYKDNPKDSAVLREPCVQHGTDFKKDQNSVRLVTKRTLKVIIDPTKIVPVPEKPVSAGTALGSTKLFRGLRGPSNTAADDMYPSHPEDESKVSGPFQVPKPPASSDFPRDRTSPRHASAIEPGARQPINVRTEERRILEAVLAQTQSLWNLFQENGKQLESIEKAQQSSSRLQADDLDNIASVATDVLAKIIDDYNEENVKSARSRWQELEALEQIVESNH